MHQLEFTVSCEIKYFLVSKFSQGHMHELLKKKIVEKLAWKIALKIQIYYEIYTFTTINSRNSSEMNKEEM